MDKLAIQALGKAVVETEAKAINDLLDRINLDFALACECMLQCTGRIIVLGVGKSGHIAGKIAATLSSTGTPAFFVHPVEAGHGDMGVMKREDVILALSNSGESNEINAILPPIKRLGPVLIAMTGNPQSTLAKHADIHLDVSVSQEACPLGLAPTSSTTAALVMGDALAVALLETRGFTREDFARSHPAGQLGRKLLVHIREIMHQGTEVPRVTADATVSQTIVEMTQKKLGMSAVMDGNGKVVGVYTDGDLRRTLDRGLDPHVTAIGDVMTSAGKHIGPDALAVEAAQLMEQHGIQALLVIDENQNLVGALNFQDLLKAGVV
jgi:arabinose-5-phosphate isomerase